MGKNLLHTTWIVWCYMAKQSLSRSFASTQQSVSDTVPIPVSAFTATQRKWRVQTEGNEQTECTAPAQPGNNAPFSALRNAPWRNKHSTGFGLAGHWCGIVGDCNLQLHGLAISSSKLLTGDSNLHTTLKADVWYTYNPKASSSSSLFHQVIVKQCQIWFPHSRACTSMLLIDFS